MIFDVNSVSSKRTTDSNGFLRVSECNITKEQVRPYLGKEIPNWQSFGLEPDAIYGVFCPADELIKAAPTFNNLPLTRKHIEVNIDNIPSKDIVGSLGDSCEFESPYLKNSLLVYDRAEIKAITNGRKKELSCGYRYTPVRQQGVFNGQPYDFVMTNIQGNHVALVHAGRAGHDVMVADEIPNELEEPNKAGENVALLGENEMAEEVKEEEEISTEAPNEEVKEEITSDACSKDEDKEEAKEKKADKPAESKKEKKEEEKDFAEGVKYGEEKEKEEPKKLDSEHESEGMKKAEKKKEAEDKCTKDEALTMDIDAIKAEAREAGRQEAIEDFKAREKARKEVRHLIGDVNVFAFDSADEIYKMACEKGGLDCKEISSFKDAFKGLSLAKSKLVADAAPAKSDGNEECFNNIRLG